MARQALAVQTQGQEQQNELLINCGSDPVIPQGCKVYNHNNTLGFIPWTPERIELVKFNEQNGHTALNANVLDFLLRNQKLIPDSFKGKNVFSVETSFLEKRKPLHNRKEFQWLRFIFFDAAEQIWTGDICPKNGPRSNDDVILCLRRA